MAEFKNISEMDTPKTNMNIWQDYLVCWEFKTPIFGNWPASPDVLARFVETRVKQGRIKPVQTILTEDKGRVDVIRQGLSIQQMQDSKIAEAIESLPEQDQEEEETAQRTLVFRMHEGCLAVQGGSIRAHLKNAARNLSSLALPKNVEGSRSLAVRSVEGLYVAEDWIQLLRNGEPLTEPDSTEEFFVHVNHPRTGAPMSSLKSCQSLEPGVQLAFTLRNFANIVTPEELSIIMQYGGTHGYGQERSRGFGRYVFGFEKMEQGVVLPAYKIKKTKEEKEKEKKDAQVQVDVKPTKNKVDPSTKQSFPITH